MREVTPRDVLLGTPAYRALLDSKRPFAVNVSEESYVTIRHIHGLIERAGVAPVVCVHTRRARVVSEDRVQRMTTLGLIKRGLARDIVEVATAGHMIKRMVQILEAEGGTKTEVGNKPPSEVDRIKATQKQQEISLKSRQAQEILQAKQRELAKKTRDDMNKIKTGEKPTSSGTE